MTDNAKIKVLVMDRDHRVRAAMGEILRREPDLVLAGEVEPDGHLARLTNDCRPYAVATGHIYISPAVERLGRRVRAGIGSCQRRAFHLAAQ